MTHGTDREFRRARASVCLLCAAALLIMSGCGGTPSASRGVVDGVLPDCPNSPNCVCSEVRGSHAVDPLTFAGDPRAAWTKAGDAVVAVGGTIQRVTEDYLHATFTSTLFRFVDDLELRLDRAAGRIHVRSASRVGYWDLGVNRRRVERLRASFRQQPDN